MAPYLGYDSDTTFIPGTLNTSSSLYIQGGGITQTGGDVNFDSGTLFIDEDLNRVGIGVTTPESKLHIKSAGVDYLFIENTSSTNVGLRFKNSIRDWYLLNDANGDIQFYNGTANAIRLKLTSDGNVGIGTNTAYAKLQVEGNILTQLLNGSPYIISRGSYSDNTTYTFYNNDTTGFTNPSAGTIGIKNGGVYTLTLTSGNTVGIGVTNTVDKLHVVSSSNYTIRTGSTAIINPNNSGFEITGAQISVGGNIVLSERQPNTAFSDRTDLAIITNTGYGLGQSEKFRIKAEGNVGIGTTDPAVKFQVEGAIRLSDAIQIRSGSATYWHLSKRPGGESDRFGIYYWNGAAYGSELLTLGITGNLGVNQTDPTYRLDIGGSANITTQVSVWNKVIGDPQTLIEPGKIYTTAAGLGPSNLQINPTGGNVGIGTTNPQTKVEIAGTSPILRVSGNAGSSATLDLSSTAAIKWTIVGNPTGSGGALSFQVNDVEQLRVSNTGNVGIGTTNPSTKLSVNGYITESTDGTNYWPVVTQQDIGTAPNQVPINGYLGSLAYEDSDSVSIGLLDITGRSALSTTGDFGGLRIQNTSTKTYPTTSGFTVTPGIYQDIQIGTSQSIPSGSFSNVRGNYNRLIKNDGTNTDVIGMFVTADTNVIEWSDTNLAARYAGSLTNLLISGTNTSGNCQINGSNSNISITNPSNTSIVGLFLSGVGANINIGTYGSTSQTVTVNTATALIAVYQCPHNQVGRNLTITTAYGVRAFLSFGGNFSGYDGSNCVTTITNLYQFEATGYLGALGTGSTTTITNLYGLFLGAPTTHAGTTITNNWGLYQNWSSAKNWFAGASNQFPNITTTASGANAFLDSADSNRLYRSSSSLVYKKDVETLDHSYADNIHLLRPVWYRSKCEADCSDWSWFGLIAEEVAEIEPRLVHYGYQEDAYEIVDITETVDLPPEDPRRELGEETEEVTKQERRLKEDAQQVPNGIAYDRLTVLLLDVIQRQEERIKALEQHVFPQP